MTRSALGRLRELERRIIGNHKTKLMIKFEDEVQAPPGRPKHWVDQAGVLHVRLVWDEDDLNDDGYVNEM